MEAGSMEGGCMESGEEGSSVILMKGGKYRITC